MSIISSKAEHVYKSNTLMQEAYIAGASRQHTDEEISAGSDYGRYQAKICEDGNFRDFLYAMSLKRLKRKCEKYAKRERKAIAYVTTLKEES